jgi:hypothetical protein
MKKSLIASGVLVGVVAVGVLSSRPCQATDRLAARMRERAKSHMKHMMDRMPEDSPPRLVMSTLPRVAEQNDRILALLQRLMDQVQELSADREPAGRVS